MAELFKGIAGSPITYLTSDISASQTTVSISDADALPPAPNICTIGFGENIETIRYNAKSGGTLSGITRGIEGTPRAWQKGTEVARFFTAYDHNSIIENFTSHLADDMNEKEVHGVKLADYIIEQGSNYTKWNSGKLEQWGTFQLPAKQTSEYGAGHYVRHDDAFEFPISFTSAPEVTLTLCDDGFFHGLSYNSTTSSNIGRVYLSSFASLNRTCRITYKAIGRWK